MQDAHKTNSLSFKLDYLCLSSVWCLSYGKTNCCSRRQWRASILKSRQPCRPLSSSSNSSSRSSRSNKSSRWLSQHRRSKSSCLPSSSKVGQRWHCLTVMVKNNLSFSSCKCFFCLRPFLCFISLYIAVNPLYAIKRKIPLQVSGQLIKDGCKQVAKGDYGGCGLPVFTALSCLYSFLQTVLAQTLQIVDLSGYNECIV